MNSELIKINHDLAEVFQTLITGAHILDKYGILDAFGQISVRNPQDLTTFYQSSTPAALIRSISDFTLYRIHDGRPANSSHREHVSPYSEHYIHAAIYQDFPGVNSIVHSQARDVLPFSVSTNRLLQPVIYAAGFLGKSVPVWDIRACMDYGEQKLSQGLLVNKYNYARALALQFRSGDSAYRSVVLQRGMGFVAVGNSIYDVVHKAIYTVENARVQQHAMNLGGSSPHAIRDQIQYLDSAEIRACREMNAASIRMTWRLWELEVQNDPRYRWPPPYTE